MTEVKRKAKTKEKTIMRCNPRRRNHKRRPLWNKNI
jgi:hypothetical protein